MIAALLLASAVALPLASAVALPLASAVALPLSASVRAAEPIHVVRNEAPRKIDEVRINMFAYCDGSQQPTIMLTNVGPAGVAVAWTLTAVMPGRTTDVWSNVSFLASGQFEGWMAPASYLLLVVHYDDDGLPATQSLEAACPAIAGVNSGSEE